MGRYTTFVKSLDDDNQKKFDKFVTGLTKKQSKKLKKWIRLAYMTDKQYKNAKIINDKIHDLNITSWTDNGAVSGEIFGSDDGIWDLSNFWARFHPEQKVTKKNAKEMSNWYDDNDGYEGRLPQPYPSNVMIDMILDQGIEMLESDNDDEENE